MTDTQPAEPVLQLAREQRILPIEAEWRASGAGGGQMTVRGHASVFDRLSLDLGGFRERIARGAFDAVLDTNPDVHLVWDHSTTHVLARTKNKTLELRVDPVGLHYWAKTAPTSYAADLRVLMERGDIDQASFSFTVAKDEWEVDDAENVTRTILEIGELFDVTITAQGAYPQTDAKVVAHMRSLLQQEISEGHLPATAGRSLPPIAAPLVAGKPSPRRLPDESKGADDEPNTAVGPASDALASLRENTRAAVQDAKAQKLNIERQT